MDAINSYTRRTLGQEEVYQFNLILCDNEIDRDQECFTTATLHELAPLFVGKTGIFDHDAKAENQTARIYHTQVVEDLGRTTSYGEVYAALHAKAYLIRCDKTQSLIEEIDGGIKKEVSIGCSVTDSSCSICGVSNRQGGCEHQKGQTYQDGVCYHKLEHATDAYEWSFVAVPAQREAGVQKKFARDLKALKKAFASTNDVVLTATELDAIQSHWQTLEEQAQVGLQYQQELAKRVVNLGLACGERVPAPMFRALAKRMSVAELQAFEESYQARLGDQNGLPQLSFEATGQQSVNNQSFKV